MYHGDKIPISVLQKGAGIRQLSKLSAVGFIIIRRLKNVSISPSPDTLSIGSDVTNESPNGPVSFCNGNIKISANDVEINGETTIQEGTSFEITTEY